MTAVAEDEAAPAAAVEDEEGKEAGEGEEGEAVGDPAGGGHDAEDPGAGLVDDVGREIADDGGGAVRLRRVGEEEARGDVAEEKHASQGRGRLRQEQRGLSRRGLRSADRPPTIER